MAVSPDLEKIMIPLGSEMYIDGIGDFTGVYEVKDLMNVRHKLSVDILICKECIPDMWREVSVYEVDTH